MDILSLYELNQLIRSVIESSLPEAFLVTAEIASCDVKNHCYMTLVDKDGDTIRAEIKAVIWASAFKKISGEFRKAKRHSLVIRAANGSRPSNRCVLRNMFSCD